MSKVLFLLLLALPVAFPAQHVFTLKGAFGINGCQIHGDNYSGYDKFGVIAGPAINARTGDRSSWELGFYFSQKGSRHNPNHKTGDYSFYRVNLNYIDLPLTWRYMLNEKYYITLGPSLAYLISYREETERGDWTGMYPFNKTEVGINFGLGARLGEKWTLELRSSNSVTPLRDWGVLAKQVYYPNAIARFFNKGLYSNLLSLLFSYHFNARNSAAQ
jgi:hypothetical protein